MNRVLGAIEGRLADGRPLTFDDVEALAAVPDLARLGALGDEARRRRHGANVTFVRVADVALGSVPSASWPASAGEIRIVGVPESAAAALDAARAITSRACGTPVTAFALDELERLAGDARSLTDLVDGLAGCGVVAIAEAPIDALRDAEAALNAVREAGLAVERVTLRHTRSAAQVLPLLRAVKQLQKHTGMVRVFAPLARGGDTRLPTTGYDDVRLVALARLWLDTVDSIQVDWTAYGPKLAQVSLLFGVDDLDNVSALDAIDQGRRRAPLEEMRRNIVAAGLTPVERTGRWAVVGA